MNSPVAPVDPTTTAGKALPVVNAVAFVLVIFINAISSTGLISKLGIGQVSDLYQTLITPAGYAFSIWGLIYFSVAVFVIWNLIPSVRDDGLIFERIGYWFAVSCLFNVIWIVCFVQAQPIGWIWVSSVFLFMIFGSLLILILRVGAWQRAFNDDEEVAVSANNFTEFSDRNDVSAPSAAKTPGVFGTLLQYFAVDFAFSIYCAWTTVASILNLALSLIGSGFYGNGHQDAWAIAILVIAALIFLGMVLLKNNWAYGFVFTWAAMAIASKQKSTQCGGVAMFDDAAGCTRVQHAAVSLAAIVGVVSALRMVYYFWSVLQKRSSKAAADHGQLQLDVSAPTQAASS